MNGLPPEDFDGPPASERYTDVGNARRLVRDHGHEIRWVPQWGTWLAWDGTRWQRDVKGAVTEMAKAVARNLWDEVRLATDSDDRKQAVKWAMASESAGHIDAMIRLARTETGIPVEPDELDRNPWLFNTATGTINLKTGVARPHAQDDLITKISTVEIKQDATCPAWTTFLEQVLPDIEVRAFLQEVVGYCLTGLTVEQILVFGHGSGANGKSTMLEVLLALFGEYGRQAEPDLLLARDQAHPTGIADLQGARLVVSSEIEHGRRLAEATVKQLTGGDRIKARYMRQDFFEFTPTHKLFIAANHKPIVRGTDHAIWRRLRLVPFTVTIPKDEQDRHLKDRLLVELPGILAWALEGCGRWRDKGLSEPEAVTLATAGYREEMDLIGAFIAEACIELEQAWVSAADLYRSYQHWCDDNGERPMSQKALGGVLAERGYDREKRGPERRWHWIGIGIVNTQKEPMNPSDPSSGINSYMRTRGRGIGESGSEGFMGSDPLQGSLPYKDSE